MRLLNQSNAPVEHRRSPKGSFEVLRQHMSLGLGGVKDSGPWGGGHPFDVEIARIPPGRKGYPYHAHAAQTEYYIVLAGSGVVIDERGTRIPIRAGDHFIFLPGEAHQIANEAAEDLEYIVVADNHRADVTTYPLTGKRMIKPEMRCVRMSDAEYYDGEE